MNTTDERQAWKEGLVNLLLTPSAKQSRPRVKSELTLGSRKRTCPLRQLLLLQSRMNKMGYRKSDSREEKEHRRCKHSTSMRQTKQ